MAWLFPKRVIRDNLHIYAWMSYAELRALHSMIGFANWQQLEDLRMEADAIMIDDGLHDGPFMLYKVVLAFDRRSLQIIGVGIAPTAMDAMERRAPRPKMRGGCSITLSLTFVIILVLKNVSFCNFW